jgi:hypothetical protein
VTAYLPDAAEEGFVTFRPTPAKTPALRSGTIDPNAPYTFSLPKNKRWKESKVANAISGNYCAYRGPPAPPPGAAVLRGFADCAARAVVCAAAC